MLLLSIGWEINPLAAASERRWHLLKALHDIWQLRKLINDGV